MALLNRFSKLNDRGETGVFTFIVTKSVTRDFHRDATTKDFCFGYHRWAISFQRPTEKVLGVHLLLRNASPSTACVVDFTLTLLNREHFSENQVYSKRQAKFTITNPMQGVSRWIQMSELVERRFSNETGEFLFELSLSNMTTIFECDIQMGPSILNQYKAMLKGHQGHLHGPGDGRQAEAGSGGGGQQAAKTTPARQTEQLINLETNCFTFGSFDWSLTIVPLVVSSGGAGNSNNNNNANDKQTFSSSSSSCSSAAGHLQPSAAAAAATGHLLTPNKHNSSSNVSLSSTSNGAKTANVQQQHQHQQQPNGEPVCRVYLNRLNGFDSLCRVKYRVILGHHQAGVGAQSAEFVDSKTLDQISDSGGRIRGYQFRNTNILKLVSVRSSPSAAATSSSSSSNLMNNPASFVSPGHGSSKRHHNNHHHHHHHHHVGQQGGHHHFQQQTSVDLRVHIEMFCANTVSEAKVAVHRKPNEAQLSNCSDRNKQAWCVESDDQSGDTIKLKLFFMDLQSVPRNHIRYISWIAYLVRRDAKSGLMRDSTAVKNAPHCNYYLQDGIDMGTIMDTDVKVKELDNSPNSFLDNEQLTVHIEWVDSLLLFSHLYNNYDALATIQRHQISRELDALQAEFEYLEKKHEETCNALERMTSNANEPANNNGRNINNRRPEQDDHEDDEDGHDRDDEDDGVEHSPRKGNNRRSSSSAAAARQVAAANDDSDTSNSKAQQGRRSSSRCSEPKSLSYQQEQEQFVSLERDNNNHLQARHQQQQQQQQQQQWPVSGQQARGRGGSGDSAASVQITSSSSASTATPTGGHQSKPASPAVMSQEERVKMSSSTPPYLSANHQQILSCPRYTNQSSGQLHKSPLAPNSSQQFAPTTRRRLPVQPTMHQLPERRSADSNTDRRDSLSSPYHQQLAWTKPNQQQQQLHHFYLQQQQQQQSHVNSHQRQLDEMLATSLHLANPEAINGPLCMDPFAGRGSNATALGLNSTSKSTASISFDRDRPLASMQTSLNHLHQPAHLAAVRRAFVVAGDQMKGPATSSSALLRQQRDQQIHLMEETSSGAAMAASAAAAAATTTTTTTTTSHLIERRRCSLMLEQVSASSGGAWNADNELLLLASHDNNNKPSAGLTSSLLSDRQTNSSMMSNSRRALSNFHVIPTSMGAGSLLDAPNTADDLPGHQIYAQGASLLISGLDGSLHASRGDDNKRSLDGQQPDEDDRRQHHDGHRFDANLNAMQNEAKTAGYPNELLDGQLPLDLFEINRDSQRNSLVGQTARNAHHHHHHHHHQEQQQQMNHHEMSSSPPQSSLARSFMSNELAADGEEQEDEEEEEQTPVYATHRPYERLATSLGPPVSAHLRSQSLVISPSTALIEQQQQHHEVATDKNFTRDYNKYDDGLHYGL